MAGESAVKLRFVSESDGSIQDDGLGVDNISIVEGCPDIALTVSSTDELFAGVSDGTVTALATGGVAPYTFMWNTMDTTGTVMGLSAGTYHVTITDANGCEGQNMVCEFTQQRKRPPASRPRIPTMRSR